MNCIKSMMLGGAILFSLSMCLTSCEGALDDVLGEWSRPTPGSSTETSISIAPTTLALKVGETGQLTATVNPAGTAVSWNSDKEAVATVDANGLVTAKAEGTATITAQTGDKSATCTVTVSKSGLLAGKFSVSATKQVQFSQGNLQATYDGSAWSWSFAANQWDYIGNAEGNNKVSGSTPFVSGYSGTSTTVDLFGWVGSSSTWTGAAQYGITSSTATNATDGYGNSTTDDLNDWGANIGTGWRTLTNDEWVYLFDTRNVNGGTGNDKSYTIGQTVNGNKGLVIYPDDYTGSTYSSGDDWSTFEAAGCVFLPAAGVRTDTGVDVNSTGYYWSSTPSSTPNNAYYMTFTPSSLNSSYPSVRSRGRSVRLVCDAK